MNNVTTHHVMESRKDQLHLQLPGPLRVLRGRDSEVERFKKAIREHNLTLILGLPGVGKSALGSHLAYLMSREWAFLNQMKGQLVLQTYSRFEEASDLLEEALCFAEASQDVLLTLHCYYSLGELEFKRGDMENALEYSRKAITLSERFNCKYETTRQHLFMGSLMEEATKLEEAVIEYCGALKLSHEISCLRTEAEALLQLASVDLEQGRAEFALDGVQQSLKIARSTGNKTLLFRSLILAGEIALAQSDFDWLPPLQEELCSLLEEVPRNEIPGALYLMGASKRIGGSQSASGREVSRDIDELCGRALKELEKMPPGEKKRNLRLFRRIDRFVRDVSSYHFVRTQKGVCTMTRESLNSFLPDCDRFDILIDMKNGLMHERTRGIIGLPQSSLLFHILYLLMSEPGSSFTTAELFERCWGGSYDYHLNYHTVCKAVSRLRSLIEPTPKQWRYIMNRKSSIDKGNVYFFSAEAGRGRIPLMSHWLRM